MNRFEGEPSAPQGKHSERILRGEVPRGAKREDPGKPIEPPASFNAFDEAMIARDQKPVEAKKEQKSQPERLPLEQEVQAAVVELTSLAEKIGLIRKVLADSEKRMVAGVAAIRRAREMGNAEEERLLHREFVKENEFVQKFRKENPLDGLVENAQMLKTRIEVLESQTKKKKV